MSMLLVATGGFFGSMLRFFIADKTRKHVIGTWIANITGSLLLATVVHFWMTNQFSESIWLFLGVGFCGAYTTFSTFSNETLQLLVAKRYLTAIQNILLPLGISLLFIIIVLQFSS